MFIAWPVANSGARQHFKQQSAAPGGIILTRLFRALFGAALPAHACWGHGQDSAHMPNLSDSLAIWAIKDMHDHA